VAPIVPYGQVAVALVSAVAGAVAAFAPLFAKVKNAEAAAVEVAKDTAISKSDEPFSDQTRAILDKHGGVLVTTVDQVTESAIVASDEIGIGLHPVTVTRSDGKAASRHDYDNMHLVFQKVGARIEVVRVQFEGLPEIQRSAFFERCSN